MASLLLAASILVHARPLKMILERFDNMVTVYKRKVKLAPYEKPIMKYEYCNQ
jgi:hypothetical protein